MWILLLTPAEEGLTKCQATSLPSYIESQSHKSPLTTWSKIQCQYKSMLGDLHKTSTNARMSQVQSVLQQPILIADSNSIPSPHPKPNHFGFHGATAA